MGLTSESSQKERRFCWQANYGTSLRRYRYNLQPCNLVNGGASNSTLLFPCPLRREWDLAHRVKLTSREANRLGSDRQEKSGCEPSCLDLSVGRAGAGQSLARRQWVRGRGRRRERVRRGDVLFVFAQGFGHSHCDEARHDKDRRECVNLRLSPGQAAKRATACRCRSSKQQQCRRKTIHGGRVLQVIPKGVCGRCSWPWSNAKYKRARGRLMDGTQITRS